MINGLDVFYSNLNKGSGLKIVENKGDGLKLIKGKGCNMKSKKSSVWEGIKNIKITFYMIYERLSNVK